MKKYLLFLGIVSTALVFFANCTGPKKNKTSKMASTSAVTYAGNLKAVVAMRCSPCHIPSAGGNKKALDSYDNLKGSIGDVINRIQMNPGDRGFMPFRNAKLGADTIAMFTQWRDAGTPE